MRNFNASFIFLAILFTLSQSTLAEAKTHEKADKPALDELVQDAGVDVSEFNHVDPKHIVPDIPLVRAMAYFKKNGDEFTNKNFMAIVDYTKKSNQPRLFIVNLKTGHVDAHLTSHGMGSDPGNTGVARKFSNRLGSDESSPGFFKTAEVYNGKHGRSLRLDGLSKTNSNARKRDIVIHSAWYVADHSHRAGRSDGCVAVDPQIASTVISKLKGGALIYGWAGQH